MSNTKPLIELFKEEFKIPQYQRGYRWGPQEVTELLDDLWEFKQTESFGKFYCLQPIVLQKNNDGSFNVLDGQQRLTTLYIILVYLEKNRFDDGYRDKLFSLNYETRPDCQKFLEEKEFITSTGNSNIDFYHICAAYSSIDSWFDNPNHAGAKGKLVQILMDKNDKGNRNVRFIWYEVGDNVKPIEVFIRLNVGKIPLTDAELTKALLLQKDRYPITELKYIEKKLHKIASEWDAIEYKLKEDDFWYFISNKDNEKPTHIEFIFDLIAEKINKEKKYFVQNPTKHSTFLILSEYLRDLIDNNSEDESSNRITAVETFWKEVVEYFEYFQEWFNNRKMYHFIGYLIAINRITNINLLINQSKALSKSDFEEYLRTEIGDVVKIEINPKDISDNDYKFTLSGLKYEHEKVDGIQQSDDKFKINRILLLHNVFTTLNSDKEKARFPFNLYKQTKRNEKWSLEHIHAQNSESIKNPENRVIWLKDHIKSFSNLNQEIYKELIERMDEASQMDSIPDIMFDNIVNEVYNITTNNSEITEHNKHSLDNLCLIDKNTNSQLNNSVFDVKREIIKKRELGGYYIPICTRNVFLKSYTEYPSNNAYWTTNDRLGYLENIQNTYHFFISTEKSKI